MKPTRTWLWLTREHHDALKCAAVWHGCGGAIYVRNVSARLREVLAAYDDRRWRCPPLDDEEPPTEDGQRIEFVADREAWKRLVRLAAEWDLSYRRTVSRLLAGWLARARQRA